MRSTLIFCFRVGIQTQDSRVRVRGPANAIGGRLTTWFSALPSFWTLRDVPYFLKSSPVPLKGYLLYVERISSLSKPPNAEDEDTVSCVFVCIKQAGGKFRGRACCGGVEKDLRLAHGSFMSPTLRLPRKPHTLRVGCRSTQFHEKTRHRGTPCCQPVVRRPFHFSLVCGVLTSQEKCKMLERRWNVVESRMALPLQTSARTPRLPREPPLRNLPETPGEEESRVPLPSPGTVYEATGLLPSHPVGSLPEETSCLGKKIESQVAYPWEGIRQKRGVVAGQGVVHWPHLSWSCLALESQGHTDSRGIHPGHGGAGPCRTTGATEGGVLVSTVREQITPPFPQRRVHV